MFQQKFSLLNPNSFFSVFCIIILFFPFLTYAKKEALMIGGGCETSWKDSRVCDQSKEAPYCEPVTEKSGGGLPIPTSSVIDKKNIGRKNLFAEHFDLAKKTLTPENGWDNVQYLYGDKDWIKRPQNIKDVKSLSRENLFKSLDDIKKRLSKSTGNQFMLTIATHGGPEPHSICMGDGTFVPVSEIKEKLLELKQSGINVGVVDASCYSGGTAEIFRDTGICAIGTTGSDVMGAVNPIFGDAVMNLFGLISPANDSPFPVRGFYHATGKINQDEDNQISMSEYMRFMRLKAPLISTIIPRSSECSLDRFGGGKNSGKGDGTSLGDQLEECAHFLNTDEIFTVERGQDLKNGRIFSAEATDSEICRVGNMAEAFKKFLAPLGPAQKAAIKIQHENMGVKYTQTDQELMEEIKENVAQLVSKREIINGLDAEVEKHCGGKSNAAEDEVKSCTIPSDLINKVNKIKEEVGNIKDKIRRKIRLLIDYACEMERIKFHNGNHQACENFPLFPATKVPTTSGP